MKSPRGKLLLISPQPFFQWRGSPIRVGFDALALAQLGFQVDLLTLPIGERKEIPGVRIFRVPNLFFVRNIPIGPSLCKAFFDCLLLAKALRLGFRNRYDFVHCIEDAGAVGVVVARITGAKLIFEKHSDPSSYKKGRLRNLIMLLYGKIEAFTVRHADAVIGTGKGLVEQARSMDPSKPVYHIFDIPSSLVEISEEKTRARRKELQQEPDDILITYAGSFAVYQGIDIMFMSIPLVLERHALARFIIIGGSASEISERTSWLARRGVESRVRFTGKVPPDELPDFLAASDILLSPRIAGVNTPLKLLDYLKAGRPIVATDNPANRQILDETRAVLVGPDPAAFARGISRLIGDAGLRNRLGEHGRRLIAEIYNFSEFKRRLDRCYSNLEDEEPNAPRTRQE